MRNEASNTHMRYMGFSAPYTNLGDSYPGDLLYSSSLCSSGGFSQISPAELIECLQYLISAHANGESNGL